MTAFRAAAAGLFGTNVSARLARALGVGQRAVQRWLVSSADVPADVVAFVTDQEIRLEKSRLKKRLEEALLEAQRQGVHPEVVAAKLAELYEGVSHDRIA